MKKHIKKGFLLLLIVCMILSTCGCGNGCRKHSDENQNGVCDKCHQSIFVYFDFYSIGDLANKTADKEKLNDYFKYAKQNDENAVFLSTGNMSNTSSNFTDWMNGLNFNASAIGEDDFNLGEDYIESTTKNSNFPFLAINVYDRETNRRADFCEASTIIENNGIKIGIIGAVGNYYDNIANQYENLYFKTDDELSELVEDEAERLQKKGADFIVYLLNIGNQHNKGDGAYYKQSLSDGYIDLVFEGNTGRSYQDKDVHGVYHLQNNEHSVVGISHAEVSFNTVTGESSLRDTELVNDDVYTSEEYAPQQDAPQSDKPQSNSAGNNNDNTGNSSSNNSNNNSSGVNNNLKPNTNNSQNSNSCKKHEDDNNDELCDLCHQSVIVYFDFYSINDLHGKFEDTESNIGVDELTTFLYNQRQTKQNAVFLSAGDMWQGGAASNMTKGIIVTDWMNELDFTATAIGNHEFDWGEKYVADNEDVAEFPFLAINIYDRDTNKLSDFCDASVMIERNGIQIGIIGAIGDCYSSIAVDKCDEVYFKVGHELTSLVKAESDRLRKNGADFIVYILHDGYGNTNLGSVQQISSSKISSYYDVSLSDGYIDLVFEGHTHQGYRLQDEYGVYHLQNRGDNTGGISHAEVAINSVTLGTSVNTVELISTSQYQHLNDDPIVNKLLGKYEDQISPSNEVLGYNKSYRNSDYLQQVIADLYYETGIKAWGKKYNIVLGGGFMSIRSPYKLTVGDVKYADLQALFPFDNQLTLCSVKGRDLKKKFFETNNDRYYISYGDYGRGIKENIDPNATYYIVVDTYTADYAYNNLTIIERYDENIFARDLLAEHIKKGGFS